MPTKVYTVKAMFFPVACTDVRAGQSKGWVLKKWCLWTVCWRRLLRVPWRARRSNQSILKEINPEYSLEALTLKLKFQCFAHLMWRTDSLEKTLMLGKIEGMGRRGQQRTRWLDDITVSMSFSLSKLWDIVKNREATASYSPWGHKESDTTEQLKNKSNVSFLKQRIVSHHCQLA